MANLSKAERIAFIDHRLQALYPQTLVPLDHRDPYTLLVAVLLSAQCTDERVNQVTPALFAQSRLAGANGHTLGRGDPRYHPPVWPVTPKIQSDPPTQRNAP